MSSFGMTVDLRGLESAIQGLQTKVQDAARPAAQAAAQVLYDQAKQNVNAIGRVSGKLSAAIYQAYSKDNSRPGVATYHVSWNARKAPHGHLVEFGHIQRYKVYLGKDGKWHTNKKAPIAPRHVAARPFLRPAWDHIKEAMAAAEAKLLEVVT